MRLSRRSFTFLPALPAALAFLWAGRPAWGADGAVSAAGGSDWLNALLTAWFDTLIPAGDGLPPASAYGIAGAFVAGARGMRKVRLDFFGRWLDREAKQRHGAGFAALQPDQREALVRLCEQSPAGTVPRGMYLLTRNAAFSAYYSKPETWASIGYHGPPQPEGYRDFASAPRSAP